MLGVALIKKCITENIKIYAFVRGNSTKLQRIPESKLVKLVYCDLNDLQNFNGKAADGSIIADIDCFYHFGWALTDHEGRNDPACQEQNIKYTLDAVKLAKKLGCKKFIGAGSQAEYGRSMVPLNNSIPCWPEIAYGVSKYAAGKLSAIQCEQFNLEFNWVRVLSVYGTLDNDYTLIKTFIRNCKTDTPMDLGPCTHQWDFLFEDDAGSAFLAIGEKGVNGKTYCLGSGTAAPLKDYLEIIKKLVCSKYQGARYGAIPYGQKSLQYLKADITELTTDTGWKPVTSFANGIKKILGN
jgi:nucleoside-diphosphate-sugar epimerase